MTDSGQSNATRDAEFARIALPLLPAVARVANALTHDAADADDLVQETFLKAFRHWNTFEQGSDCRRWLSAICRNTFFAQRARQRWVTAVGDDLELETFAAVSLHKLARDKGVEDMFSRLDLAPAIRRAIDDLDPLFRDVVQLVDVQELRYEEAADILGVPIGTIRSRLFRARRQLQQSLVDFAIDAGYDSAAAPQVSALPSSSALINAQS
ncbi:MAG: sigma-70 family RNA polymerase sigma factor [bacterium]